METNQPPKSDTTRSGLEAAQVARLEQTFLRRQGQDSCNIIEHMCFSDWPRRQLTPNMEARRRQKPIDSPMTGAGLPALDTGDDRLRGSGSARELSLGEARPYASLPEELRRI